MKHDSKHNLLRKNVIQFKNSFEKLYCSIQNSPEKMIVPEGKLKNQLIFALNHRKPFANFKWQVENSEYRNEWFAFKANRKEKHVRDILIVNGIIQT